MGPTSLKTAPLLSLVWVLVFIIQNCPSTDAFADWMAADYCDRNLKVGEVIMNADVVASNARTISVYRSDLENRLHSGDSYMPGETLIVELSESAEDKGSQFVLEATNAKFVKGGCDGRRVTHNLADLILPEDGSGSPVEIVAGWAIGHGEVSLSDAFVLNPPMEGRSGAMKQAEVAAEMDEPENKSQEEAELVAVASKLEELGKDQDKSPIQRRREKVGKMGGRKKEDSAGAAASYVDKRKGAFHSSTKAETTNEEGKTDSVADGSKEDASYVKLVRSRFKHPTNKKSHEGDKASERILDEIEKPHVREKMKNLINADRKMAHWQRDLPPDERVDEGGEEAEEGYIDGDGSGRQGGEDGAKLSVRHEGIRVDSHRLSVNSERLQAALRGHGIHSHILEPAMTRSHSGKFMVVYLVVVMALIYAMYKAFQHRFKLKRKIMRLRGTQADKSY